MGGSCRHGGSEGWPAGLPSPPWAASTSGLVYLAAGAAFILVQNLANALLQTMVPDHLRGRVMGVFMLTFFGSMPLGSLLIGFTAHWLGPQPAVALNSLLLLAVATAVYMRSPQLRAVP